MRTRPTPPRTPRARLARVETASGAPEVCVERRSCRSGAGLAGMLIAPLALLGSRLVIGVVADNVSSTTLLFWDQIRAEGHQTARRLRRVGSSGWTCQEKLGLWNGLITR